MINLEQQSSAGVLRGVYAPEFKAVVDTFNHNFEVNGEVGASLCVTREGESVVDVWGGVADSKAGTPWHADTICVVFSSTKGAVALAAPRAENAPAPPGNHPMRQG